MRVIETTASIPTEFCTVIQTTKCPPWVVRTRASQIQDGGKAATLEKWKNRHIFAKV